MLAFAAGLRRALHPGRGSTWGPPLIAANGVSLIIAGVFLADPIGGYPAGRADEVTVHGTVHSAAPALAGITGLVAYVLFVRRFTASGRPGWAWYTILTGVVDLALAGAGGAGMDFRLVVLGAAFSWTWTSLFALDLYRPAASRSASTRVNAAGSLSSPPSASSAMP